MQPNDENPQEQLEQIEVTEQQPTPDSSPLATEPITVNLDITEQQPKKSKKGLVILILTLIISLLAGVVAYWWYAGGTQTTSVSQTSSLTKQAPLTSDDPLLASFIAPKTGEKWLASPKKFSSQLHFYTDENSECGATTYYEVGSRNDSTIVLSEIPGCVGGTLTDLFEKAKDGSIKYIARPISNGKYADRIDDKGLAKTVIVDKTTHYDSLSAPSKLPFGTKQFVNVALDYPTIGEFATANTTADIKETNLKAYGQSKLVKTERRYVDTKLSAINYTLHLPTGTQIGVTYKPIDKDLSKYTWNDGSSVKKSDPVTGYSSEIRGVVRGCGAVVNAVTRVDDAKDSDFIAVGKTPDGQTVYGFKDLKNHVVQAVYKDYLLLADGSSTKPLSIEDFIQQHAIIAYRDVDGSWLVYNRDQFAIVGGCGKPVVYLYPTKTQTVTVRVGADVSVSVPKYIPTTGWNTLAQPNGQLTVNGQTFDSLFWEGTGHGAYPGITAGTVVKRADAAATIRSQLVQQGLNQKETDDFMTFWQPKIPNDPYIRLTWFNTAQLDQLAPLIVSPKPDTTLRVFLDMAGYDSPIAIPAQKLTSTARKGFTVVEWGGLLTGKQ